MSKLASIVQEYVGCSLKNRTNELAELCARNVDDPKQIVQVKTNCAVFSLGVLWKAGIQHKILNEKYVLGSAIACVRQIAIDLGVLKKFDKKTQIKAGTLMHYNTPGKGDNHVEWCISDTDQKYFAIHAGAGRADNAVTMCLKPEIVSWSIGRPLIEVMDFNALVTDIEDVI